MGADFTYGVDVDLAAVRKQLATLPTMTGEAGEKALRQLTASFDRATVEAKKLNAATKAAAVGVETVQKASAQTAGAAGKLAGALNMVSPELAGLVTGGKAAADVLEVMSASAGSRLAPALGAVGVAAAAAGVAYLALAGHLERATATMEIQAQVATSVQTASAGLERARIDLAVATGELSEAEGRQAIAQLDLGTKIGAAQKAYEDQGRAVEEAGVRAQKWLDGIKYAGAAITVLNPLLGAFTLLVREGWDAIFGLSDAVEEAGKQNKALDEGLEATTTILKEESKAVEAAKLAAERKAAADRAAAAASQAKAEAARNAAAAAKEEASTLDRLRSQTDSLRIAQLDGIDQVIARRDAELLKLEDLRMTYGNNVAIVEETEAARLLIIAESAAKIEEIRAAEAKADNDRRKDAAKWAKNRANDALAEARAIAGAYADAASSIAGSTAEAIGAIADGLAKKSKGAARAAFAVAKVASIAQIAIDTAKAVSGVNAAWAWNPPVNAALSAAAGVVGGVQAGIVASQKPSFHVGGMIGGGGPPAPDERDIRVTRKESVLNGAATSALGEEGVNALNSGQALAPSVTVNQVYRHRIMDSILYDAARMPGSSFGAALSSNRRPVGRRG